MREVPVNPRSSTCEYKEVVIIGNGPSGIMLSYMLSGNWPYYTGGDHPDELLTSRLRSAPSYRSLVQQDLRFLSQGLEGRSCSPAALLMDALQHPCADLGVDLPSLVRWRHLPARAVDHVVLGRGPPGGSWQSMDGSVLTLSLASWMSLPGLELRAQPRDSRVTSAAVAQYYDDYVRVQRLSPHFRSNHVVRRVWREEEGGAWRVQGAGFDYRCRHVVLAVGSRDKPNHLGLEGETRLPWLVHDLRLLEVQLDRLKQEQGVDCDPVLIVGAGLSAADAVIAARYRSLPVIHVFRKLSSRLDTQLPENMYPEYHKVHQMMGDPGGGYPRYTAMPGSHVTALRPDGKVRLQGPSGETSVVRVSVAAILIGAKPDLDFLSPDCRPDTLNVDPFTYEVTGYPGMHALGPLAGDNFVRFIQGGALCVTSHIHAGRQAKTCEDT